MSTSGQAALPSESRDESLRILHLEDDPHDRDLAAAILAADGMRCEIDCVDTREAFEAALLAKTYDMILADYALPAFDGLTAQAIARRMCPETPFIFLSGSLGEELAIDRLKDGATDYVLKQRMARLPAAVRRARQQAVEHAAHRRAQEQVRQLNAELERRVVERTGELSVATAALARHEEKLRASQQQLESILDNSPAAMYVKDLEGRYLLVNRRVEQLLGRSRDDVVGKTDFDLVQPRIAESYRANDRRVEAERRALRFDEVLVQPDGVRVFTSSKFPVFDAAGRVSAICGIAEDVTDRKRAEDEVKLARLEAVRANRAKNEFLSRMSHDLRTPLNAILGFAQLLDLSDLPAESREAVHQIVSGGRHLLELITEVLDIARIEAGRLSLSPEPVRLDDVVPRAVDLVRPLAASRNIVVDVEPLPADDPAVFADRQRLMQVLLNLLSNAVKYNRDRGRVTVRFQSVPPGRFRISVADTGAGLAPEKIKLLFQPFERLGAEQTPVEGTGLGLVLSRALTEAMGGALGVDSVVDVGTTFWIELASAETPLAIEAAAPATAGPPPAERGTILYIEDNLSNVRLIERILARRPGLVLRHAPDGRSGIAMVRTLCPDLLLLDVHLPDISGEEVLRELWADPAARRIPKIVMTADASPGLSRALKAAGATDCVTKPLDIRHVLARVDELLSVKEPRRG